jgi:hypothetical protein
MCQPEHGRGRTIAFFSFLIDLAIQDSISQSTASAHFDTPRLKSGLQCTFTKKQKNSLDQNRTNPFMMMPANNDSAVAAVDPPMPMSALHRFSSGSKSDQDQAPEVPRSCRALSPTSSASTQVPYKYGTRKSSACLCKSTMCTSSTSITCICCCVKTL